MILTHLKMILNSKRMLIPLYSNQGVVVEHLFFATYSVKIVTTHDEYQYLDAFTASTWETPQYELSEVDEEFPFPNPFQLSNLDNFLVYLDEAKKFAKRLCVNDSLQSPEL